MKGQVVLITGGASGISAATAKALLARGAVPVLIDCDRANLATTAADLKGVLAVCLDVTDFAACQAAVAATLAAHGRIDVVWANAGIAAFGPLLLTDLDAFKRCVEVNVFGTLNIVRAALPAVITKRSYVLATASVSSFAHPPAVSSYAASKAAIEAMCNCWRIELAAHGMGVGAIYASWVQTPLVTEGDLHPAFVRLKKHHARATTPRDFCRSRCQHDHQRHGQTCPAHLGARLGAGIALAARGAEHAAGRTPAVASSP